MRQSSGNRKDKKTAGIVRTREGASSLEVLRASQLLLKTHPLQTTSLHDVVAGLPSPPGNQIQASAIEESTAGRLEISSNVRTANIYGRVVPFALGAMRPVAKWRRVATAREPTARLAIFVGIERICAIALERAKHQIDV